MIKSLDSLNRFSEVENEDLVTFVGGKKRGFLYHLGDAVGSAVWGWHHG